jgi:HK97 family phage portal protein
MGVLTELARLFVPAPLQTRSLESFEFTPLGEEVARVRGLRINPWRSASIKQALGVPAIQRAVSLIANTTGSLTVQGLRDGMPMPEQPRILGRPDPFQTPREFYRDTAYYLATRGEAIWWIAARDNDGLPASLIVVPLNELTVEKDPRDRRFPIYRWGKTVSTRFAPIANLTGQFVHLTYLREPGELRGTGPLQMCGAAVSVTVEAQEWAANFFAGDPSTTELKSMVDVTEEEAVALKAQWLESGTSNLPRVTNPTLEWKDHQLDPKSAQMTEARTHQDGEAARMFGIPGKLLEYGALGSSLTYQNIAEVFTDFVRSCLSINYLEPIEQALSDLLPRTTAARFNVEGLLRADIKTRFGVYESAVKVFGAEEGAQYAREREGLAPGNPEMAPTPFVLPAAIPASFPAETRSKQLELALPEKHPAMMLAEAVMTLATREQPQPITNIYPAPITVEPAQVTIEQGAIQVDVTTPDVRIENGAIRVDSPVTVEPSRISFEEGSIRADSPITVNTPDVRLEEGSIRVGSPVTDEITDRMNDLSNTFSDAMVDLKVMLTQPKTKRIVRDEQGRITAVTEE